MSTSRDTLYLWRMDDHSYAPRSTTISHMFALCDTLTVLGESVPAELNYRPSPLLDTDSVSESFPDCEYLEDILGGNLTVSEAQRALLLLNRYLAFLPSEDD